MDIVLATAHQILESERCPQCGMYVWMCHSEDPDMQIEVEEDVCEAKRALTKREEQIGEKAKPWVSLRPVPVMADPSRDFVDLRVPYFEEEARKQADPVR